MIWVSLYLDFGVQNVGNGISELQDFKIFWGACPQTFLEDGALWSLNCHSRLLQILLKTLSYNHFFRISEVVAYKSFDCTPQGQLAMCENLFQSDLAFKGNGWTRTHLLPFQSQSSLLESSINNEVYYCKGVFLWKNPKIFPLWSQITQIPHSQRDEEPKFFSLMLSAWLTVLTQNRKFWYMSLLWNKNPYFLIIINLHCSCL